MAATLTARYGLPFVVWSAATLALVTKGLLALTRIRFAQAHSVKCAPYPFGRCLCDAGNLVGGLASRLATESLTRSLRRFAGG
jgi:hypothetical protein